jgi:hypothetical protein
MILNCHPFHLYLLNRWDYRHEAPCLTQKCSLKIYYKRVHDTRKVVQEDLSEERPMSWGLRTVFNQCM